MVSLTDAVVSQVSRQALPLVLRIVVPLPLLELLTGQILVLRLPLGPESGFVRENHFHCCDEADEREYSQVSCTGHKNSSDMTGRSLSAGPRR